MADNISITAGSGTSIATDDIGGVHYQRIKQSIGADGSAADVSAGAGAVDTGTQRVTLASDDPAVTKLAAIDNVIVNGTNLSVSVPASGFTTIATITNTRYKTLVFQFDVATQALDQFQILAKAHADATNQTFGVSGNSWTDPDAVDSNIAPGSRILETNGNLDTIAAAGNGYFAMDVTGLVAIVVQASAAVSSASVSSRWSLQP